MRPVTDIVFPKGNEERLVEMAARLGYRELILCYEMGDPLLKERAKEVAGMTTPAVTTHFAVLAQKHDDVMKAKQLGALVVALPWVGAFEDKRVTHILGIERGRRDDFLHHRNSGLTQVSLREAARTGKTILIDASALLDGEKHPGVVLGRILQNNDFLRKEPGVPALVVSAASEPLRMRAPRDLQDLLKL